MLERIAPQGRLRRISVEIGDSDSKPRLLVLADQDCSLREARAIRYQDGRAKSLLLLDGEFQPRANPAPCNLQLTPEQCTGMRDSARQNGLLR